MNFTVEPLRSEEYDKWNEFVNNNQETSIFHTIEWKQLIEEVFDYIAYYHVAKDDRGNIIGISPAFICPTFSGKSLISMPFFEYGGPFVLKGYEDAYLEIFKKYTEAVEQGIVKKVRVRSLPNLQDYIQYNIASLGFVKAVEADDFVIETEGKNFENDFWNKYSKESQVRTEVRKALRHGAKLNKKNNWKMLQEMVLMKDNKLGSPSFPKEYFKKLEEKFADKLIYITAYLPKEEKSSVEEAPEKHDYVSANTDGMIPAGTILGIKYHNRILVQQLGDDEKYLTKCSTSILWNEMIKEAVQQGIKEMDLGRSKPGSTHAHVKEKFMPTKRTAHAYYYPEAEDHYKYRWVGNVFSKAPWLVNKTPLGQMIIKRHP